MKPKTSISYISKVIAELVRQELSKGTPKAVVEKLVEGVLRA